MFPRDPDEIVAAFTVCKNLGVPLVLRGGGTSIAGNAMSTGVVLDTSRYLNKVLSIDPDARTAVVQPGAVLDDITKAASTYGLRFGPDPSTHSRATIGGAIGNNACGSRALAYGRTVDNVVDLDILTGTGVRFTARRYGGAAGALSASAGRPEQGLVSELIALASSRLAVDQERVRAVHPAGLRLLAGAPAAGEGHGLREVPCGHRGHPRPDAAGHGQAGGGPESDGTRRSRPIPTWPRPPRRSPPSCRSVRSPWRAWTRGSLRSSARGEAAVPAILPDGGGWLFIETAGDTTAEAVAAARRLVEAASCLDSAVATGPQAAALWRIREDGTGLAGRTPANAPAWPGWEDSAVPPENLPAYLRELQALLKQHDLDGLMFGHFGDGCIHVRIDFPLRDRPGMLREFTQDAARLAAVHGGSASGEHGDGRARGELLTYMYSESAIDTFAQVKRIFDPGQQAEPRRHRQPGRGRPAKLDANLRVPAARPLRTGLGFAYSHDGGDLATAVHRCVGVGKCRADNTATGGVMCPSFLATRDEKDSTRGRARVLQELANGSLVSGWDAPEIAEALDLCLACKGCSTDCPAGVDMATYKAEALYQRYRGKLRPASHYSLGWLPRFARLATVAPKIANFILNGHATARLIKRLGGIDDRRPLPRFAARSFRRWFASRGAPALGSRRIPALGARRSIALDPARSPARSPATAAARSPATSAARSPATSPARPVLLWVDTFTNAFSPWVGQAAVRVLEDAGYSVQVTARTACCGLTWISTGQLDGARKQLRRALDQLGPALDAGIPIVGLEPSCLSALRGDAAELLPFDPRARKLAGAVKSLAELLRETDGWTPPDLSEVTGVAQPHCHHRAAGGWASDAALLSESGAAISAVGGCCGLAGNFGVERGHYDVSVQVAETALLPAVRAAGPGSTILADGFSCRTQLDQLAGTPGTHLAELLASRLPPKARESSVVTQRVDEAARRFRGRPGGLSRGPG